MCLRFMFLLTTRLTAWLRLARREETEKSAENLILRHQRAVLQRQPRRPELNWADRALLATLLSVIPKARRHGLRLLVTPDTILRWHRDIIRRRWPARSIRGKTGRPAIRRDIKALILRLARENPGWGYRSYAERRIMPSSRAEIGVCPVRVVRSAEALGIIRVVPETPAAVGCPVSARCCVRRSRAGEGLFFERKVGEQVDLGGFDALVAEPERDDRDVDAGLT